MAIVNSHPLTVDILNDPLAAEPLTPNHLLTMRLKILFPPPGNFQRTDLYCRKIWRRVQYLVNVIWTCWKREFLQALQERSKWCAPWCNVAIGDVVLMKDENLPRNVWQLGCIIETLVNNDSLVCTVKVTVGDKALDKNGRRDRPLATLKRSIHKLVLVHEILPTEETYLYIDFL